MKIFIALLLFCATSFAQRDKIPGQFIVVVSDDASPSSVASSHGIKPSFIFTHAIHGFCGSASDLARAGLSHDGRVKYIEQDAYTDIVSVGSWGLDRIDQRHLPLNSTYTHNYTGAGVTAYIIDCGIRYDHQEFGGRARFGYDVFGGDGSDCYGHGTHVAGTVGGATYGVAPGVSLVSVKVLDCTASGTVSGLIAGINWVIANKTLPAVANISIGAGLSSSLNTAVANLMAAGVVTCVAAGNSNVDASTTSPSSAPEVITVGATDQNDAKASFSNYGLLIDIFAPGVSITSSYYTSTTATANMSGTSMATPHVVGVCALELQHHPTLTAQQCRDSVCAHSTKGIVTSSSSANNNLLYSLEANDTAGSSVINTNIPPVANFSFDTSALTATFTDASTDADGTIASWYWTFGDASISYTQNPVHTYVNPGTYSTALKVTDNIGATNTKTSSVVVKAATSAAPITLTYSKYKVSRVDYVDLKWGGFTSTDSVRVYRNNSIIATKANNIGSYTDNTGLGGKQTFVYKVATVTGLQTSPNVTVQF